MFSGESVIAGTSTTGTGTLTLAATPGPPGGVDFDVWARAAGFGNSAAITVVYTLIEYTDTTFATASQMERGDGTLTLGGSSGITNCTLARTNVISSVTSMGSQPATYNVGGSAVSIGTANRVLVFLGPGTTESAANQYHLCDTVGDAKPSGGDLSQSGYATANAAVTVGFAIFWPFIWTGTRPITKAGIYCTALNASSVVEVGIYQLTSNAVITRVQDLTNGRANLFSGASTGYKQNTSAGGAFTAFYLPPGRYIKGFLQTGGAGTWAGTNVGSSGIGEFGTTSGQPITQISSVGSQTSLAASYTVASSLTTLNNWVNGPAPLLHLGW